MENISIIIPVYNAESTIRQCIESITMQTYPDFCIYAIDDCSTDNSLNILKQMSEEDKRIRVLCLEANQGPSVARNLALNICRGKWISFVDSDDYIDKDFYNEMLTCEEDADIIIGSFIQIDKSEKKLREYKATSYYAALSSEEALDIAYGRKDDLDFVYNLCCNKLYRRTLFNDVRFPSGRLQEDAFVMPYLICKISKYVNCAENAIYYYVDNDKSISHQAQDGSKDLKRREDLVYMYECHIVLYKKLNNRLYFRSRANLLNNIVSIYRLHYSLLFDSNKETFQYELQVFRKHYIQAIKEGNPYLSRKLLLSWLLFIMCPKLYLKLF